MARAWAAEQLGRLRKHGRNVILGYPLTLHQPWAITLGSDIHLAEYVHIWGGEGVSIGDRVMVGSHTAISAVTHDYTKDPMWGHNICAPVVIGNDVWIGTHALIMPGIAVGDGAVIGAGAVVTKDVPPRSIVAGVPARVLRERPSGKGSQ